MNDPGNGPMAGKVVLVTGATAGIGKVTAMELARQGATILGIGRNAAKAEAAAQEIRTATGNPRVDYLLADLSSVQQVQTVAAEVHKRLNRLDVLVNNAGAIYYERGETAEGFERTFALNHLAYFALTNALLDLLKATPSSRVVSVSSDAHRLGGLDFDDLQNRRSYSGFRVYGQSKLANILFSNELTRRLQGTGVTSNALHPGFVRTEFGSGMTGPMATGLNLIQRFAAISPEKGAQTSIYLATSPQVNGITGKYFAKSTPVAPSKKAQDTAAAQRLWEISEQMVRSILA